MEHEIPKEWLEHVVRILQNGDFGKAIVIPVRVRNDWDADTLGATFITDLRDLLIRTLNGPGIMGKLIFGQPEPGETYAFWFYYNNRKFFGKICLHTTKTTIKLLSAHLPNKGNERL
jgi:hypothetical protein